MSAPGGLKAFQLRMAAAVMAPLTSRWTMARRRPDGTSMADEAAAFVKPNSRLGPLERLEIYNRSYWFRVLDSLEEDFQGLLAILGRKRFTAMARAYLADCPSTSFTMRNLGSRLEAWLRANPRCTGPLQDLAVDMAALEWAHVEAFDEAALPALEPGGLGALEESTRLFPQPHLRVLELRYPVDDLAIEVRDETGSGDQAGNAALASRRRRVVRRAAAQARQPIFLAVHRHQDTVYYRRLVPEAGRILRALVQGLPLGTAVEAGFEASAMAEAERPGFLRDAFHHWASLGWFAQPGPALDRQGDLP